MMAPGDDIVFWQVFRFKPREVLPNPVCPVPGKPAPSQGLVALLASHPGHITTVMSHSQPYGTFEEAARTILAYPYADAEALVVEAQTGREAQEKVRTGVTESVTLIAPTADRGPTPER